jgi:hypothetical protein
MSSERLSRRRTLLLVVIVLLVVALGCNLPWIAPEVDDPFAATPSQIPFEALVQTMTAVSSGVRTPEQTQPVPATGPSSTPPPTVTAVSAQCQAPALIPGEGQALVSVYFHCDEQLAPVLRLVPQGSTEAHARAALEALLEGPTLDEQAAGYTSWFSQRTAGALRVFIANPNRQVIVDLRDFSAVIPNASSSAGSQALLDQLSATVFQFPEYQSVLFTFEGDCNRFWNWLQMSCSALQRMRNP